MRLVAIVVVVGCGAPTPSTTRVITTEPPSKVAMPSREPRAVDMDLGKTDSPEAGMLRLVNEYRRVAGVPPVVLDPALTEGCREHTAYMVTNRDKPQLYSINAHTQDPALPGATAAGAECGKHAVLYPDVPDLRAAVHGWMGSIFHRAPVISPQILRVGIGASPLPVGGRMAVALQFVYGPADPSTFPIIYPVDGQRDVPIDFINEAPTPIPPGGSATPGYPVTLTFPPYEPITNASATIVDDRGASIEVYISSPEKPASQYSEQPGLVGVIPRMTLRAGTQYTATITATWNGKPATHVTHFTTRARIDVVATDEAALLAAIGKPSRVRGVIKNASLITSGTLYLKIQGPAKFDTILSIDAVVPLTIAAPVMHWAYDKPKLQELSGLEVAIDATPNLYMKTYRLDPATGFAPIK